MDARPWENRIFDSSSVSKQVIDSQSGKQVIDNQSGKSVDKAITADTKELESGTKQQNAYTRRKKPIPHSGSLRKSDTWSSIQGLHPSPHAGPGMPNGNGIVNNPPNVLRTSSHGHITPSPSSYKQLSSPVSPQNIVRQEDSEEVGSVTSTTARSTSNVPIANPQFGTRYSNSGPIRDGTIRDDESMASSTIVPSYMQATQSVRNKSTQTSKINARSRSQPKQRPATPDKDAAKKRLSYIPDKLATGPLVRPLKPGTQAQRSPTGTGFAGMSREKWPAVSSHATNDSSSLVDEQVLTNGHPEAGQWP